MKKILIIGGNGYIGSYLKYNLPYLVSTIDIGWFNNETNVKIDYNSLDVSYLSDFDSIILLAGHSSVKMCEGDISSAFNNNVVNFIRLLEKIKKINKRINIKLFSINLFI